MYKILPLKHLPKQIAIKKCMQIIMLKVLKVRPVVKTVKTDCTNTLKILSNSFFKKLER